MNKEIQLTHRIPLIVCTLSIVELCELRTQMTEGKKMVNEISDIKPVATPHGILIYYTYYGEQRVTQSEYLSWAFKNKIEIKKT